MRKISIAMMALVMLVFMSSSAMASNNSLTLFGSHGPTYLGLEYEHRIKGFGVGIEFGAVPFTEYSSAFRINALGRYYFGLKSPVTPFVSLAPGALFYVLNQAQYVSVLQVPPPTTDLIAMFYMYGSAGLEYKFQNIRAVLEAGGSITVSPIQPEMISPVRGGFIVKMGVGLAF
ncbi:MAG TPA: hypothetical protein PLT03_02995 [Bacillota bacterium]|nr:hypothetical protein [Bacillota bacterium]HOA15041.1 hypothetical protein [Bacillota bacterium]HOG52819.1 hypothetical protein [Bacillota bacterium]